MNQQRKAYAFGLSAVIAWSTVATAFKITLNHLSPAQLVFYSSLFSLICIVGIITIQGDIKQFFTAIRNNWKRSLILGAINPFVYYLILFQAYDLLPAQEAQALNYTWALTMTLLAVPILKQKLKLHDALAACFCYLGVLFIATRGNPFSLDFANIEGVIWALLSTLLWAIYWLLNTKDDRPPVIGLGLNFLMSMIFSFIYCLINNELHLPAWQGLAGAAYIGLFEMGITFVLWLSAMKLTDSTAKIANLIFLSPLLSLFFISTLLGEQIFPSTLIGLALILGGLILQKIPVSRLRLALR